MGELLGPYNQRDFEIMGKLKESLRMMKGNPSHYRDTIDFEKDLLLKKISKGIPKKRYTEEVD